MKTKTHVLKTDPESLFHTKNYFHMLKKLFFVEVVEHC